MIRRIREFMFNILQELQNYHGGLCSTLTRGIPPVAHAQHGFAAPTPIGLRSKQLEQQQRIPSCPTAPPVVQLAQIRSQNRRSPSGPGTRAARSHGSQPKQVIWLKKPTPCVLKGPQQQLPVTSYSAGSWKHRAWCARTVNTGLLWKASGPLTVWWARVYTLHLSHLTQKLRIAILPSTKYMKYLQSILLDKVLVPLQNIHTEKQYHVNPLFNVAIKGSYLPLPILLLRSSLSTLLWRPSSATKPNASASLVAT